MQDFEEEVVEGEAAPEGVAAEEEEEEEEVEEEAEAEAEEADHLVAHPGLTLHVWRRRSMRPICPRCIKVLFWKS